MKKILTLTSMIALSACSQNWDVDEVNRMTANGSEFDKSLKHEYVELAIVERHYGDWSAVDDLLSKAVTASKGQEVPVVKVTEDMVEVKESRHALDASRNELVAEFNKGAKVKNPQDAAKAQVSYECIVNGVIRNMVNDVIHCEELFNVSMDSIQGQTAKAVSEIKEVEKTEVLVEPTKVEDVKEPVKQEMAKEETKDEVVAAVAPVSVAPAVANPRNAYTKDGKSYLVKNGQYYIYYALGNAKPAQNIDTMLSDIVMEYKILNPARVEVNGYADTTGSIAINEALSLRRAKTVANALVKSGIEKEKIEAKGFGETNLAVPTADGVAEPLNRRTTVEFK